MSYRDDLPSALARLDDAERRLGELTAELTSIRRLAALSALQQVPELLFLGIQGAVVAVDRSTGEKRWHHPVPGSGPVNLVCDGASVYSGSQGEIDRIESRTGRQRWRNKLRGFGLGLPALATSGPSFPHTDRLFVALGGRAAAVDKQSGETVWQSKLPASGSASHNLVLLGDDLLVMDGGELVCLDPASGAPRWHNQMKGHGMGLAGLAPNDLGQFVLVAAAGRDDSTVG